MDPNRLKWVQMGPKGPDGSRWVQMGPDGSRLAQIGPDGSKLVKKGSK
jgi:hypothetical protein